MDVISHAVEGYTSNWHNDYSDGLCLKAIQLVFTYLPRAYQDGSDREARERMHNAATIAGLGFSNTAIVLAHAMAHAIAGSFHLPHGRVVGLFLPYTIEYNARVSADRYAEICRFLDLPMRTADQSAVSLAGAIRSLAREISQPTSLRETGIPWTAYQEALPKLVNYAICAPEIVATPRLPYTEDLEKLFFYAYEGKTVDF
jgi:alcohol dehydrogenase class IV